MIAGVLAALLAAAPSVPPDTLEGSVQGRVLSAGADMPVAGAAVELRAPGEYRLVLTDDAGRYRIAGLAPGPRTVAARALDHAPLEAGVVIPADGSVTLDLRLDVRPVVLPSLYAAVPGADGLVDRPRVARGPLRQEGETALRALEAGPGVAELGLGGGEGRPGPDPGDPSSVLFVRGAAQDLKLVLLDGAPVYAPFHLSGLVDAFPQGLLEKATLYTGGTPARLDGGLSYVLEMELREGDPQRFRSAGSVDFLGAGARAEGPLGSDARLLVGARTVHGFGYPAISGGDDLPYGYGDLLGRVDLEIGAGRLSATGFWNRESVELGPSPGAETLPSSAFWGNAAGSLRYHGDVGGGTLALTAAHGSFRTRIPIEQASFRIADGWTDRSRAEALYAREAGGVTWAGGLALDAFHTALEQRSASGDSTSRVALEGRVAAAHAEARWRPAPDVEVRTGVRADYFLPDREARLAPRASVAWRVGERAVLRLAAGRFHQFVRGPESILSSDLTGPTVGPLEPGVLESGDDVPGFGGDAVFAIAGSTHLVVGLENRLENDLRLGLEGYFKTFDDLPEARALRASGADLWIHREEGAIRGWIGYSLAWVWTADEDVDRRFVGRHLLTGGIDTEARGFELGLRLAYGAGLPFTAVATTVGEPPPSPFSTEDETARQQASGQEQPDVPPLALSGAPDDSYLRLDAEISRPLITMFGDRRLEIAPYLRVLNALDTRDALFYRTDEGGPGEPAPLASVPLLAVLGVSWAF
ncbi:MAG: TonB-dependent receptor [Gemmatimonadota bacterium]